MYKGIGMAEELAYFFDIRVIGFGRDRPYAL